MKTITKETACFPAGTRITTDKGLKRIEDIQVGDMVLSKHESGIGEQEFKPVIRTVVHHNKPIFELTYAIVEATTKENGLSDKKILNLSSKGQVYITRATPNHPFWVKGQGWTSLDKLEKGQLLEMKDSDTLAYVIFVSPEYQTNYDNVTASYGFENEINFGDKFIDNEDSILYTFQQYNSIGDCDFLLNGDNVESPINVPEIGEIYATNQVSLQTVYNFEVADNHTYYITNKLWVHNTNCPVITDTDIKT